MDIESEAANAGAIKALLAAILIALIVGLGFDIYWVADNEKDKRFENPTQDQAKDLMHRRDWDSLLYLGDSWLRDMPEEPYALYYKGRAHFGLKQWEEAVSTFETLKAIEPSWSENLEHFIQTCNSEIAGEEPAPSPEE